MRNSFLLTVLFTVTLLTNCTDKSIIELNSGQFRMVLNGYGEVIRFEDNAGVNYHFNDSASFLISLWQDDAILFPEKAVYDQEATLLTLNFHNDVQAEINVQEKNTHITFELISLTSSDQFDLIVWGPYATTLGDEIGETVGVVRNADYAIGIQTLNTKTLGGYPWKENDALPQFDIFESGDYDDLNEEGKREVLYRVEAAKPTDFGSSLQAYTRNRNTDRIIKNLGKDRYLAPAFDDGGLIGSKIALFGSTKADALATIGEIELAEGLPHPMIDGVWTKVARAASASYLIMDFEEETIDQAIDFTKKAGLSYLYHSAPFENWGHFKLNSSFPNGRQGLKKAVDKARENGISVGVHTLSNFITTNDPYVTPNPDERLAKVGSSTITEAINASQRIIPIVSPEFFRQLKNNNLKTVQVGTELIRYGSVTEQAPWQLLDCQRAAFGTHPSEHDQGAKISLLADHPYQVFLTSVELGEEMAQNIADLFNETGLRQISFDGVEGNRSTGMGNYGEILFTDAWYQRINDDIKDHFIADASRTTHYFWHMYTRMNWGEPWYAGFRESQTEYRLKNQKYFKRNYMPAMLGWFKMRPTTSIEDIEWMLARSAAFNAGYAFVASVDAFEKNGYSDEILHAISEWEKARMLDVFSKEQQALMENIDNEFHLETTGDNQWELSQVYSYKFVHEKKVRQPGEPLFSSFGFDNNTGDNNIQFILSAVDATIDDITFEVDNYKKIELGIPLSAGQSLKYSGGAKAVVYDENWQAIAEVVIDDVSFNIKDGPHTINFNCEFSQEGKLPQAKLEIRLMGPAAYLTK